MQVCPICRDSNPIPAWSPTHDSNVHKAVEVRTRYHQSCIQGWFTHLTKRGEYKMTDPCSKLEINTCLRDLFPVKHSSRSQIIDYLEHSVSFVNTFLFLHHDEDQPQENFGDSDSVHVHLRLPITNQPTRRRYNNLKLRKVTEYRLRIIK